jgi:hypothetical protein
MIAAPGVYQPGNVLHIAAYEKRAACGSKRPKSREETPKEGGGNAERYRTATT